MKIVFAGTPEFALAPLKAVVESGFEVVGVEIRRHQNQRLCQSAATAIRRSALCEFLQCTENTFRIAVQNSV